MLLSVADKTAEFQSSREESRNAQEGKIGVGQYSFTSRDPGKA